MKRSDISNYEVCKAVQKYQNTMGDFPYETLAKKFNCDEKLAYSACERACDEDLIEYGVSLRTGWLTEKGKTLIDVVIEDEEKAKREEANLMTNEIARDNYFYNIAKKDTISKLQAIKELL